jgi:integrase
MPDLHIPKLCHHKASDQAVVRLGGKDYYLGPWGSHTTRVEYDRLVGEWLANGRRATGVGDAAAAQTSVAEVMAAFWTYAQTYYRHADGTPTKEIEAFKDSLRPLRRLYGHTPAAGFGPLALKAVRQVMIDAGLCRSTINQRIGRIKHLFKWAVENELAPPSTFHGLDAVAGLRAGRSAARESEPIKPVPAALVDAVLPFVAAQVKAMIELQLLTGMRPGEIVIMRAVDIDTTGKVWIYKPAAHKTRYLGHERTIMLGPRAQVIIKPFLKPDLSAYLFSPADADAHRRQRLHLARKTPMSCGNVPGSNVRRRPAKKPMDHYSVGSYSRAIKYGCAMAHPLPEPLQPRVLENGKRETKTAWRARLTVEQRAQITAWRNAHDWHPHQLRHAAATQLRKTYGLEPAQVILGHKTLTVTQVYAERNVAAAMRIMSEVG